MSNPAQPLALCSTCAQQDKGAGSVRGERADLGRGVWAARASILCPLPSASLTTPYSRWGRGRLREEVPLVLLHPLLVPAAPSLAQSRPWWICVQ